MTSRILCGSFVALMMQVGCSGQVAQTKVAVTPDDNRVTREDALTVISMAVCKRFEDTEGFGNSKKYASHDDCIASERTKWGVVWSEDKCSPPHAPVSGKVKECKDRASTWQVSSNVLDFGALVTECNAGSVCK